MKRIRVDVFRTILSLLEIDDEVDVEVPDEAGADLGADGRFVIYRKGERIGVFLGTEGEFEYEGEAAAYERANLAEAEALTRLPETTDDAVGEALSNYGPKLPPGPLPPALREEIREVAHRAFAAEWIKASTAPVPKVYVMTHPARPRVIHIAIGECRRRETEVDGWRRE